MIRKDSAHAQELFNGEFQLVQSRLKGGAVYTDSSRARFLRLGEKEMTAAEEVHTVSLKNKGFPVAAVLSHGQFEDQWYFIEESLGEKPLGHTFNDEYKEYGQIKTETFNTFLNVIAQYCDASLRPNNRQRKSEDLREISSFNDVRKQFKVDQDQFEQAMQKAEQRLGSLPAVTSNIDLGPYNTMPKGIIDFEFLHNAPIGYDLVTALLPGYYFPKVEGYYHRLTNEFTSSQIKTYQEMIDTKAMDHGLRPFSEYRDDFIFLKTIWLAARPRGNEFTPFEEPDRERFWSSFRATILQYVIREYLSSKPLDFTIFPKIGISKLDNNNV